MKIITYSDLHLEFGKGTTLPPNVEGDVLVLAGDIITFKEFRPLAAFVENWKKPIIYIAGNHEYYTKRSMYKNAKDFENWATNNIPHLHFLQDSFVEIDGVQFFGGTMWTDFNHLSWLNFIRRHENNFKVEGGQTVAMQYAYRSMNDYRYICKKDPLTPFVDQWDPDKNITPQDTIDMHEKFKAKLLYWFKKQIFSYYPTVVVTHHSPVKNVYGQHFRSQLEPAYVSLDMLQVIEEFQPDLWIYGHTHEPNDRYIGNTRIISNPRGYPIRGVKNADGDDFFECEQVYDNKNPEISRRVFDRLGKPVIIDVPEK